LIVQYWGSLPNNTSDALKTWQQIAKEHQIKTKEQITASQTINPEQGKGSNRSKADVLTIGNLSSFWLEEAMKFAGVFIAAIPRTVSGVKDRKTYVLLPRQTDFGTHRDVYKEFQKQLWPSTAIKMDILAALSYSKLFAAHFAEAQSEKPGMTFRPDNHVQGLATAFYKDLGSAVATMNLATVNLPDWANALDDHGKESALELVALFDEHIRIVRMLDEGKGEEEELLRSYRDFLSSRDPQLTAFFAFTNRYAAHIMSKMVRRQPVTRITTRSLEVIVMSNDQRRKPKKPLGPIITNQGFQNIAEAIRRSTVIPQYQKNQGTTTYEVRYGLGDKLKRKAHYPLQFIQELSDFMHLYNQENARIAERRQMQFRKAVTTEDIEAVAQLLDDYGDDAPAVAYLLIAYGYARDPKERDSKSGSDQPPAENSTEDIPAAEANATDTPDGTELPF
jgi:integrase